MQVLTKVHKGGGEEPSDLIAQPSRQFAKKVNLQLIWTTDLTVLPTRIILPP